jgi:hypothetical protein
MAADELTPTRVWQALVPDLQSLAAATRDDDGADAAARRAADTAERLLLLVHYSIDWDNSWVAEPKHRKRYWDEILPSRVRRAAYRSSTLDEWWSSTALRDLGVLAPRQRDRRLELAALLREPPLPVLNVMITSLPALVLRVHIIADAVAAQRKAKRE